MPRGNLNELFFSATYHECMTGSIHLTKINQTTMVAQKKKPLILISFSVYQKPFSIECDKISFKFCLFVSYQQHFSPKICLPRNTVNAHMYPNVKCYLYYNIYDYIFFGKNIVFLGVPTACVLVTDSGTGLN